MKGAANRHHRPFSSISEHSFMISKLFMVVILFFDEPLQQAPGTRGIGLPAVGRGHLVNEVRA